MHRELSWRALSILVLTVAGAPAGADAQNPPPWLRAAMGLDTVGAPTAWEVTDRAARASVLEAFAPGGPWGGDHLGVKPLDEWPGEPTVVDFSGDGVPDVILRPSETWLETRLQDQRLEFLRFPSAGVDGWFELYQWIDGEFVLVGEWRNEYAFFTGMSREHPWSPTTLKVRFNEVFEWSLSHYEPSFRGDTLHFRRSLDVLPAQPGETDEIFDAPRPFVVENQVYSLRTSPRIDEAARGLHPGDQFGWSPALREMPERWEYEGNRMAVYERGARGVALASATDDTGRVWWYVLMDPDTPPVEPRFGGPVSLGGWMSSRFLRELGRSPGGGSEDPRSPDAGGPR